MQAVKQLDTPPPFLELSEREVNNLMEYLGTLPYKAAFPIVNLLDSKLKEINDRERTKAKEELSIKEEELSTLVTKAAEYDKFIATAKQQDFVKEQGEVKLANY